MENLHNNFFFFKSALSIGHFYTFLEPKILVNFYKIIIKMLFEYLLLNLVALILNLIYE